MKKDTKYNSRRPYCIENAGSHPNSEAKRCKARSVLGWGTAREHHGVDGFFGIAKILDPDSIKLTILSGLVISYILSGLVISYRILIGTVIGSGQC